MAVRFRGLTTQRVIASLQQVGPDRLARLRQAMELSRLRVYDRQQQLVAVDTGRMKRLTRSVMREDGLRYEIGWLAEDFVAEGEDFYPPFPELGTVKQAAQPSLLPALFEEEPVLLRQLGLALQGA